MRFAARPGHRVAPSEYTMSMRSAHVGTVTLLLLGLACNGKAEDKLPPVSERAKRIHMSGLLFDGHNDLPWRLRTDGDFTFTTLDISKRLPTGQTDIAKSIGQLASLIRHKSLVMVFSDLLAEPGPVFQAMRRLRHRGHDVILFHILDEAEVHFPYDGMIEFEDPETSERIVVDATSYRHDYKNEIEAFRA